MYAAMAIFSFVDGFFGRLNQRFNLSETGWSRRLQLLKLLKISEPPAAVLRRWKGPGAAHPDGRPPGGDPPEKKGGGVSWG
jgi:hypothetical protein